MPEEPTTDHYTQGGLALNLFGDKTSGARGQLFGGSKSGFIQMCDDEDDSQVLA